MILSRPLKNIKRSLSQYIKISSSIFASKNLKFFYRFHCVMSLSEQGKRVTEPSEGSIAGSDAEHKIGGPFILQAKPKFLDDRIHLFDELYKRQAKLFEEIPKREIVVRLKDGKEIKGKSFQTTPADIAKGISKKLLENALVAKVTYTKKDESALDKDVADAEPEDGPCPSKAAFELYDLSRPLEGDCELEILDFDDPEGATVFKHSSAHILGAALELLYGAHLCIGPPLENGFYYDCYIGDEKIAPTNFDEIAKQAKEVVSQNLPFQRLILSKDEALKLFSNNPFKQQLIKSKVPEGAKTSAYRCGSLVDLCRGPHVPSTARVKAFNVTKASAAYWLGKKTNDDLQRVYGVSFPTQKQLDEWTKIQEEIAKRDHRTVGAQQNLFEFDTMSPGSCFFFPHGAKIYNNLVQLMRRQYVARGFQEVVSPNMFSSDLWKISGHYYKYKNNIFWLKVVDGEYGLKPMNCPGHCLMFDKHLRSYKELPIRYADFGVLHRNELHGALTGLTRVRRFQQDDAHIFCTMEQILEEIMSSLDFLKFIYDLFGFEFKLELSTRPDEYLGKVEDWDKAEAALTEGLNSFGRPWKINPGDGAFYGPKIDVKLFDALKREHQCGTIQLDFNLPIRFNLQYRTDEGAKDVQKEAKELHEGLEKGTIEPAGKEKEHVKHEVVSNADTLSQHAHELDEQPLKPGFKRPVIIHRAILGSVERMIAILTEHTGGKWPFWLSPRQIMICPVSEKFFEYAEGVYWRLKLEGFSVEIDKSNSQLPKKIRNAQLAQFNFIGVVGEQEEKDKSITLRERDQKDLLGKYGIENLVDFLKGLNPGQSDIEKTLWQKALTERVKELDELDKELQSKMFLTDKGYQLGARDQEVFEQLKGKPICAKAYPNLSRWLDFMNNKN